VLRNTSSEYGAFGKCLHWGLALLILFQVLCGLIMGVLSRGSLQEWLVGAHKSIGLVAFTLATVRFVWRETVPLPDWAESLDGRDQRVVHVIEWTLYVLMLAVPMAGLLMGVAGGHHFVWFGVLEVPDFLPQSKGLAQALNVLHRLGVVGVVGAVCIHVAFVLDHRARRNAGYLHRMLPRLFR
jgi:cytochrome b561